MKVLVVIQYFWPEAFRINDLALGLRRRDHEVKVFTGKPNYPTGKFLPATACAAGESGATMAKQLCFRVEFCRTLIDRILPSIPLPIQVLYLHHSGAFGGASRSLLEMIGALPAGQVIPHLITRVNFDYCA